MSFCGRRFNLYLLLLLACLGVSGCALWHHNKKKEPAGLVRVFVESESSSAGANQTVKVLRSQPVMVNISTEPILTESDLTSARVLDTQGGGFALELKFEEMAGWRLEQFTAINPGKHLVIYAQWGAEPAIQRWLAAPFISHPLGNSTVVFTPDASRAECDELVKELNVVIKKNASSNLIK